ncbi:MAG: acyl-CoA dehydrogenase family protein [Elusimicrobiota bacterium]|nr:acyl-CoA dehydrogenase family protein [Elusimicrobiota bacterium]
MDFDLEPRRRRLAASARELGRRVAERPARARELLARGGLYGLRVPRRLGGPGAGVLDAALTLEALADGGVALGELFALGAHLFSGLETLLAAGRLDKRAAGEVLAGRRIVAHAVTEAQAGSDLSAITCAARRAGAGWRVTGRKSFVTGAADAAAFVVYAKTAPRDGLFGLSAFLVEAGEGVRVEPPMATLGLREARPAAVDFDARVPRAALLGRPGGGRELFRRVIAVERAALPAVFLGQMERLLRRTARHAAQRRQFSRPLLSNQAVSHRLAEHRLLLERSRLMLYRACWLLDQGRDAEQAAALAKWTVTESALRVALDCVQLHGAWGVVEDAGLAGELRDAVSGPIFSGTNEIQKEIVAASLQAR